MYWPSWSLAELITIQGKRAITWGINVRIDKFKILTSSSLMWLQFIRTIHCQIPFISKPNISSKVQLMSVIKNKEIFLVQISTRPFPKHIYRSLRALLNTTLTRNEFGSFQTQPLHKIEGSKPCIYTFYTKTRQIPYSNPYKKLDFHTRIHTYDLIFHFLLSSLPFFLSLIRFCSIFLQDQNEIFILVLSLFDLIHFLFHFGPLTL